MFRKDIVIPSGAMALSLCLFSAQAEPLKATQYGDFDRYVLALSWQTGFCQSMVERNRNEPDECRLQKERDNKADFLTVHGLWPGLACQNLLPHAAWMNVDGCVLAAPHARFRTCRK